jgi:predicted secreted protein
MSRRARFGRLAILVGLALFVLLPAAAGAQEDDNYVPTTTVTTDPCENPTGNASVCGTVVTVARNSSQLPFTGGSAALLTVVGLGVVGAGVGLVMIGRRSASTSTT